VFLWDTDHPGQLEDRTRDVRLRFTPLDSVVTVEAVETSTFNLDNNDEPRVEIQEGLRMNIDVSVSRRVFWGGQ
jgi:hypothetical protein